MKTYFEFSGTAKRQEYWGVLVAAIAAYIAGFIALEEYGTFGALFSLFICVAALWVMVATTVRRLNDAGLNRLWVLATVVPTLAQSQQSHSVASHLKKRMTLSILLMKNNLKQK
jgi:uncharacterized membrane protein YhaH (DUF805 family)